MTTTKTPVTFTGELKWVMVPPLSQPQKHLKKEKSSHYVLEVECSQKQYNDLIKQGVSRMTILREDETTGKTYIKIRCPKVNGTYVAPDPVVKDAKGDAITDVMIGNGSEGVVSADIETFTTKDGEKATALRFHTLTVTKLIPFERQAAENNDQSNSQSQDLGVPFDGGGKSNEDW
jgi:hypothetical protein